MNDVFEEVMAHIAAGATGVRYMNWDIGQLDGYYLKPGVSFPCALISFPQINFESQGNLTQHGDTFMQIKLATASLSNTSNLTPALVRTKGNEIWDIEKLIMKALHGVNGLSHNSMMRTSVQKEEREDGLNVLNIMYTFIKQDYTTKPVGTIVSPVGIELLPFIEDGSLTLRKVADYATFNSDMWLTGFIDGTGYKYAYQVASCGYNGAVVDTGEKRVFATPTVATIPIQDVPFNTLPAHNIDDPFGQHLNYDQNWIDFLQGLPIAEFLTFRTSPWWTNKEKTGGDLDYPIDAITVPADVAGSGEAISYGEAFQIDCGLNDTFSIEVEFIYIDASNNERVGHTIEYTEQGMYIDGAWVAAAHTKIYSV